MFINLFSRTDQRTVPTSTLKQMTWLFSIVRQSQTAYHCSKGEVDPANQLYSSLIRFVGPCNTQAKISPPWRQLFSPFLLLFWSYINVLYYRRLYWMNPTSDTSKTTQPPSVVCSSHFQPEQKLIYIVIYSAVFINFSVVIYPDWLLIPDVFNSILKLLSTRVSVFRRVKAWLLSQRMNISACRGRITPTV